MYDAVCDSCGNRCQIPFQPRSGKPVYCSHCFEQREKDGKGFRERPQNHDQLASLHVKLDKILALLAHQEASSPAPRKEAVKVEKKPVEEKIVTESPVEEVATEAVEEEKPVKKTVKKAATKKKATTKKKA